MDAASGLQCACVIRYPAATPAKPMTDPTDRSIYPAIITRPRATAMMQRVALCSATFTRLSALKKPSPRNVKKTNITMKAAVSGAAKMKSAARPCRFLNMRLFRKALGGVPVLKIRVAEVGRVDQIVLGQIAALELGNDPALLHDQRTIGESDNLFMVGRYKQHGATVPACCLKDDPVQFAARSDVDPLRRFVHHEHADRTRAFQPAADDQFLLGAPGQLPSPPERKASRKRCLRGGVRE